MGWVTISLDDRVAVLTFDRPPANALNIELELAAAFMSLQRRRRKRSCSPAGLGASVLARI